jgi:hypothetical protein
MATTTLSIRVTEDMRWWLERFAKARGSVGGAAARLLEEARRKEEFPGVEFRDTPLGRVAYVQGTRIQMALARRLAGELKFDPDKLARHYGWQLWKAESAIGYMGEFAGELARDEEALLEGAGRDELRKRLPRMESFPA